MTTSTQVNKLKINKLTKEQFSSIIPSETELYFVTNEEDTLPSQEGHEGEYLTTDGTISSWTTITADEVLPSQIGESGKFLSTDGTDTLWKNIDLIEDVEVLPVASTIYLTDNKIYKLTSSTSSITFSLPSITDTAKFHQIMVQLHMSPAITINAGTSYYFTGEAPDLSEAGDYDLVWEYDNVEGHWVFGVVLKGTA